jgi:hypothetical protein
MYLHCGPLTSPLGAGQTLTHVGEVAPRGEFCPLGHRGEVIPCCEILLASPFL